MITMTIIKKKWMDKRKNKNWIKIQYKPDIWYRLLDRIKDLSLYCRHRVVFRELYAGHVTVIYLFFFCSIRLSNYFIYFSFISIISRWSWLPFNDNDYIDPKRLSLDNDNINRTYTHTHSLIVKDCKLVDYHHHYHI